MYNFLQFAQFLFFLHIKYLDFCQFAISFADYWNRAQGLSKKVSNVINFYHRKKGGGEVQPVRLYISAITKKYTVINDVMQNSNA